MPRQTELGASNGLRGLQNRQVLKGEGDEGGLTRSVEIAQERRSIDACIPH